jgi:ABC-2 type transport system ATP-binding protein
MATGLARPSSGSIRILGEDPWDNTKLLKRIAYVPDGDAPWPQLTGLEAATRVARLSGLKGASAGRAAGEALGKVGLAGAADKKIGDYSRGMRQRIKFAFALINDADLWLLDEPLLATDPLTRRDLLALIREHAQKGGSALISTHVLTDIEALTDRVALLARGRLLAHGTMGEIRDLLEQHPRTVRIATTQPRELSTALLTLASVNSVEPVADAVLVKSKQSRQFFDDLQDLLAKGDIPFTSVVSLDDDLESIFRYLVSE